MPAPRLSMVVAMTKTYEIRSETDRDIVLNAVWHLPEGQWSVEIKRLKSKRTLQQNALYWRWIHIIADETGNDAEDIHEAIKLKFIEPEPVTVFGETVTRRSTANKDIGAMAALMNKVHAWAHTDLDIHLPLPEERFAA
ncbi:MAG: hypothetical protein ACTS10_21805 [Kiloniellales bacterium]